jgi:aminoglycoside phosphotransferase (APT) family kinase protein
MNAEWVAAYVSTIMDDCPVERIAAIARFEQGENHTVFRVSYLVGLDLQRDVVVRVLNSGSDADRARAEREAAVLTQLAGTVSPRILDFSSSNSSARSTVMCLEYLPGRSASLEAASPSQLARLGATLRQTHAMPIDKLAPMLDGAPDLRSYVEDRLQSMMVRMSLVRDPLPASTQTTFHDAAIWAERTAAHLRAADDPGAPVLLHGDVSSGNILWTPRPVLIDWEYARIGDAADEIGYLFGQNALRQDQRDGLWQGYGHDGDRAAFERTVERAAAWEPLTLFGSALYWIDLWSRRVSADATRTVDPSAPKSAAYYLDVAERYLDRCTHLRKGRPGYRSGIHGSEMRS